MKRYDKYKVTNIEWIGEIPEHWEVYRVKNLVDIKKYYQIGDGDHGAIKPEMYCSEGVPYIRVQNLTWNGELSYNGIVYIPKDIHKKNTKSHLFQGDLLIAKTGATIGKLGIIPDGIKTANTTSSVAKVSVDKNRFDNKYILYSFMSPNFREQLNLVASQKSAQPGFNNDELVDFYISVPKREEQTQISSYLDNKTSLIDKLINNNKKLIKLLDEKRTALINKVITKGLDPNVKMRDSGIEWIGEIPEHWEVKRLKYLTQLLTKRTRKNQNLNKVALENIQSKTTRYVETDSEFQADGISFKKGDLLFGKLRPYLVKIWVAEFAGSAVGDFFVLRNNEDLVSSEYLKYLLISDLYVQLINGSTFGAKMPRVSWEFMTNIKLLLPNLREQAELTSCLESLTREIDDRIKFINRKNKLLKEYRQSLISNVVTGKVKVINL